MYLLSEVNKMYKNILLFLIIIVSLTGVSSATFSDNFDDSTFNAWDATSGTFSIVSPNPIDGTPYAKIQAVGTTYIQENITTPTNSWTFDVNAPTNSATFYYRANPTTPTTDKCLLTISTVSITATNSLECSGLTAISAVTLTNGATSWFRIVITDMGTTMNYKFYNLSNGTVLFNEQNVGDTTPLFPTYNAIRLSSSAAAGSYFDNIEVSGVAGTVTSSTISWGNTEYVRGETTTFTWQIINNDWDSFDRYFIRLYKNNILQEFTFNPGCLCYTQLGVGTQTGSYSLFADSASTWRVTLEKATATSFWTSFVLVDDDETRIRDYTSAYLVLPTTGSQNIPIEASFNLGQGDRSGAIQTFWIDQNGLQQFEKTFYLDSISGTTNLTFYRTGKYNVKLIALGTSTTLPIDLDVKSITISFVPTETINNYTSSNITINAGSYYFRDIITGNYTIDRLNFSNGTKFIDVFNIDSNTETGRFYFNTLVSANNEPIGLKEYGTFSYYIVNTVNVPDSPEAKITWLPGNNSMRLMLQNTSGIISTLASTNFTLSTLTATGYGLIVEPKVVKVNQNVYITTTAPADAIIAIEKPNGFTSYYNVSSGNTTTTKTFSQSGMYGISLMTTGGSVQISDTIQVLPLPVTPTPAVSSDQTASEISDMLSSKIFWALLFIIGIMLAVAVKERGQ